MSEGVCYSVLSSKHTLPEFTRATFQYILNSIMLKDTAGILTEQDIHHLNTLLVQ